MNQLRNFVRNANVFCWSPGLIIYKGAKLKKLFQDTRPDIFLRSDDTIPAAGRAHLLSGAGLCNEPGYAPADVRDCDQQLNLTSRAGEFHHAG